MTLMYSALCSALPAISLPLAAGFTIYSAYSTLNNGYELYNELYIGNESAEVNTIS